MQRPCGNFGTNLPGGLRHAAEGEEEGAVEEKERGGEGSGAGPGAAAAEAAKGG